MVVPKIDIKQLLEAGVHLDKTLGWNPKMKKYVLEKKTQYIIDLTQTVDCKTL